MSDLANAVREYLKAQAYSDFCDKEYTDCLNELNEAAEESRKADDMAAHWQSEAFRLADLDNGDKTVEVDGVTYLVSGFGGIEKV